MRIQDQFVRSTSLQQYGVRVKFVFEYRRHIGAIFIVVFKFKFKFKFKSLCLSINSSSNSSRRVEFVQQQDASRRSRSQAYRHKILLTGQFYRRISVVLVSSCSISAQSQPLYSVSVGKLAQSLSVRIAYRLSLSRRIQYPQAYRHKILLVHIAVQYKRRVVPNQFRSSKLIQLSINWGRLSQPVSKY